MIDCTKTENYLAEKQRMTKRQKSRLCKLSCTDCPKENQFNGSCIDCTKHWLESEAEE